MIIRINDAAFLMEFFRVFNLLESPPRIVDLNQVLGEIKFLPDRQCRTMLSVKDHPYVGELLNVLPKLHELVLDCDEFKNDLISSEKVEILKIYFDNLIMNSSSFILEVDTFHAIMSILCQDKAFDLLAVGIEKKIMSQRRVLIYFLNHRKHFIKAIQAEILEVLDVTIPILAGKGILHELAEAGEEFICFTIINRLTNSQLEFIKSKHFTSVDGNSILHSAILSGNHEFIRFMSNHFQILCSHQNNFGYSPFKLALVNGLDLQSIKVLLENNCVANSEEVIQNGFLISKFKRLKNLEIDFKKFSKWAPRHVLQYLDILSIDMSKISELNLKFANYLIFGLLNSYRKFIDTIDQNQNILFNIQNYKYESTSDSSTNDSSNDSVFMDILSILSYEKFKSNHLRGTEKIVMADLIEKLSINFFSNNRKGIILKNLTKLNVEFDYSSSNLNKFIGLILKYSEPSVLAHFVSNVIDYYFCVKIIFDQNRNENYESLIPFLDAIGFHAKHRFRDGTYPIHLAVQSDNLNLLKFLLSSCNANLLVKTSYENNNVLHYGLDDRISGAMSNYLLESVPELLIVVNNFHVTPIQMALMNTNYFDRVQKFILTWQDVYKKFNFNCTYSEEIYKRFNELMELWPENPKNENCFKDKFAIIFETCGSESIARLLLSFVSRKLFKHAITVKDKYNIYKKIDEIEGFKI